MKKWIVVLFVSMSLGCTYLGFYSPENRLFGTWGFEDKSLGSLKLTFNRDMTYRIESDEAGAEPITGQYEIYIGKIKFLDDDPRGKSECYEAALYDYVVEDHRLEFTEYADQCKPRKFILQYPMVDITPRRPVPTAGYMNNGRR